MKSARLFIALFLFAVILFSFFSFIPTRLNHVLSAIDHVVISEIMATGDNANDEFVELYNESDTPVVMSGWRLRKEGPSTLNLILDLNGTIPARGYFLIAHP